MFFHQKMRKNIRQLLEMKDQPEKQFQMALLEIDNPKTPFSNEEWE